MDTSTPPPSGDFTDWKSHVSCMRRSVLELERGTRLIRSVDINLDSPSEANDMKVATTCECEEDMKTSEINMLTSAENITPASAKATSGMSGRVSNGSVARETRQRTCTNKLVPSARLEDLPAELLQAGTVYQPGGRDADGRPIVVVRGFHGICCETELSEQVSKCILFYYNISCESVRSSGITILADARVASFDNLNILLKTIYTVESLTSIFKSMNDARESFTFMRHHTCIFLEELYRLLKDNVSGIVTQLLILANEAVENFVFHSPEYRPHINLKINVISTLEKLHSIINPSHLPQLFEGSIHFDHSSWLNYRKMLESFHSDCCSMAEQIVTCTRELNQLATSPQSISEATSMLEMEDSPSREFQENQWKNFLSNGEMALQGLVNLGKELPNAEDFKETPGTAGSLFKQVCESYKRLQNIRADRKKRLKRSLDLMNFENHSRKAVDVLRGERLRIKSLRPGSRDNIEQLKEEQKDFEDLKLSYKNNIETCNDILKRGEEMVKEKQDGEENIVSKIKGFVQQLSLGIERLENEMENFERNLNNTIEFISLIDKVDGWKKDSTDLIEELDNILTNNTISKIDTEKYLTKLNSLITIQNIKLTNESLKKLGSDEFLTKWKHCRRGITDTIAKLQSKQAFLRNRASNISNNNESNEVSQQNNGINPSDILNNSQTIKPEDLSKNSEDISDICTSPTVSQLEEISSSGNKISLNKSDLNQVSNSMDISVNNIDKDLDCDIPFCPEEQLKNLSPQQSEISTSGVKLRPRKVLRSDSAWTSTPYHDPYGRTSTHLYRQSYGGTPSARPPLFDVREYMLNPAADSCSSQPMDWFQRINLTSSARYNRVSADCSLYGERLSEYWDEDSEFMMTPEKNDSITTRKLSTLPASVSSPPSSNEKPRKIKWKMIKRALSLFSDGKESSNTGWSRQASWRASKKSVGPDRNASIESLPGLVEDLSMLDSSSLAMLDAKHAMQSCCRFGWNQTPPSGSQLMFSNRYTTRVPSSSSDLSCKAMVDRTAADHELRQQRLTLIMSEMISTEKDYINSLSYVIDHYIPEILRDDVIQPLRGKKTVIFENVENIHDFHSRVFHDKIVACASTPYELGACFLQHSKQRQLNDNMDLSSYLLKPVQRMGKYALLLKQIIKECPETHLSYPDLKAALEMVRFQLRHGNNLLAMDCLRGCDVNVQEQGMLLRQEEFLVYHGRRKCLRHVFLFEELLLFSKAKHQSSGQDLYIYKDSIKTADLGLTESVGDNGFRFEVWFRKRQASTTWMLQASTHEIKANWTRDISRILWKQTIRNRERRQAEMACMGIGGKPSLDIKTSKDNICDRLVEISNAQKVLADAKLRGSALVDDRTSNKRPHSLISLSSSSSSGSGFSSGYGSGLSSVHSGPGWPGPPSGNGSNQNSNSIPTVGSVLRSTVEESIMDTIEEDHGTCENLPAVDACTSVNMPTVEKMNILTETPLIQKSNLDITGLGNEKNKITQCISASSSCSLLSDASTQTTLKRPTKRGNGTSEEQTGLPAAENDAVVITEC